MSQLTRQLERDPARALERMARQLPDVDRQVLSEPGAQKSFASSMREAVRQGSRPAAQEMRIYARPWGFRLEDIRMRVHLWQGELDMNVSPEMGRHQAAAIPDCVARFYPDEGHMSLPVRRMDDILPALIRA